VISRKLLGHRNFQPVHYIFAAVFTIRILVLARLTASPFLLPSNGDMHFYDEWAQRILRGQFTDHLAFYGLPGFAYLLALLYKLCGYGPFVPAFLLALFDAGTASLIYKISSRIFGSLPTARIAAVLATSGWALFVPAQTYAVVLMPTSLVVFVFWFVVWKVVEGDYALTKITAALLGLLVGLTATIIATILFLIPLLLAAIFFKPASQTRGRIRSRVALVALLSAGVIAGTTPCWSHNYFVAHDPVFLSAHSGINFWIGNNPTATGYPRFPPGLRAGQEAMLQDSITAAESAAGHSLKRGEISQFWSAQASAYIRSHPGAWLRLLLVKLSNVFNAFQYDDLSVITLLREQWVTFPGIYFGIVAALGLPAAILAWRTVPRSRWIMGAITLHVLALLPVFTTERYRLPIVPGLLIFAGYGVAEFWRNASSKRFRSALAYAALLCLSVWVVSRPQTDSSLWALDAYNSGVRAFDSGDLAFAREKLDLAYAYSAENAEINFAKGNLELATGDTAGAKEFYRLALQLDPHHAGVFNNLGVLALRENDWTLAARFFEQALAQSPKDPKIYYLLANAHLNSGERDCARAEISQAISLDPTQSEFRLLQQQIEVGRPLTTN
jgi:hypothetical protein